MKILITGGNGNIAKMIKNNLSNEHEIINLGRNDLNVLNLVEIESYLNIIISDEVLKETNAITTSYIGSIELVNKTIPEFKSELKGMNNRISNNSKKQIVYKNLNTITIEKIDLKLGSNNILIPSNNKRIISNQCVNTNSVNKFYEIREEKIEREKGLTRLRFKKKQELQAS